MPIIKIQTYRSATVQLPESFLNLLVWAAKRVACQAEKKATRSHRLLISNSLGCCSRNASRDFVLFFYYTAFCYYVAKVIFLTDYPMRIFLPALARSGSTYFKYTRNDGQIPDRVDAK